MPRPTPIVVLRLSHIHRIWWMRTLTAVLVCAGVVLPDLSVAQISASPNSRSPHQIAHRVEFWHVFSDPVRSGWIQARAEAFNRLNPGLQVVPLAYASYPGTFQALATAARSGRAPALVQISEAGTQLAIDSMLFRPLSDAVVAQLKDMFPAVLRYYTVGGQVYGLPFNTSSPVLYANRTLLKRAGLGGQLPRTLEELTAACRALRASTVRVKCLTFPVDAWYFEQWAAQQGALWVDGYNGRTHRAAQTYLTSEAVARPLRWLKALNDAGDYLQTGKREDNSGVTGLFVQQKAAFLMTSSSRIGQVQNQSRAEGFEVQVGPMPVPAGRGRGGVIVGGGSLWIPRELPPESVAAAQAFALFLTQPEQLAAWHRLSGYDPLRAGSVRLLEQQGWFRPGTPHTVAFEQFRSTPPSVATAGALFGSFYEVRAVLHVAIEKVLVGTPVEEALASAKTRADQILKAYNARF